MIENLVRENVKKMMAYSSARDEFIGSASVFLDANESAYDTGFNRYPDPNQKAVKKAVAAIKGINAEHIVLGNGSDELIDLLVRAFCNPGKDEIMITSPTYGMYKVVAGLNDVAVVDVPLDEKFNPMTSEIIKRSNAKTKILCLCTPNNPTGNGIDLKSIEWLCNQFPGIVMIDEAYIDFSSQKSTVNMIDRHDNLVIIQTFSKAWGLANIRLGMAFSSEPIINILNKIKPPYNVNGLTQTTALKALSSINNIENNVRELIKERERMIIELNELAIVRKVYPSQANFILVKFISAIEVYNYLIEKGIVVRNRTNEVGCSNCLRLTIGTPVENELVINVLKQIV